MGTLTSTARAVVLDQSATNVFSFKVTVEWRSWKESYIWKGSWDLLFREVSLAKPVQIGNICWPAVSIRLLFRRAFKGRFVSRMLGESKHLEPWEGEPKDSLRQPKCSRLSAQSPGVWGEGMLLTPQCPWLDLGLKMTGITGTVQQSSRMRGEARRENAAGPALLKCGWASSRSRLSGFYHANTREKYLGKMENS